MKPDTITIVKNNHCGQEVWRYAGEVIAESSNNILIKASFNRSDLLFNGVLLKENDRFIEFYSRQKWFNIYEIYDRDDGLLKAWYCNITRPAHWAQGVLTYDDLALDLLIFPSGVQKTLDEEEFEHLDLSVNDKINARKALEELKEFFSVKRQIDLRSLVKIN